MERIFHLKENGTTVKTEILAGLTTFMTMAYIIALNPNLLTGFQTGTPLWNGVFLATCIASAIGTVCMAFLANKPFVMAPGMGLNSFFAVVAGNVAALLNTDYTSAFQAVLCIILVEGIVFLLLTVTHVRQLLIDAVPMNLKYAIVVGIGMFIAFIGLQNAGIVVKNDATVVALGHVTQPGPLLACCGLMLTAGLMARNVQGSLLIGILVTAVLGMVFGVSPAPSGIDSVMSFSLPSLAPTLMQLDIMGALKYGIISIIFTFTIVELFDNMGTLIGLSRKARLMDDKGHIENLDKALVTDSVGTVVSSFLGTSTVTSYVESAAGISQGGRTGLTALTVAVLFAASLVFAPLIGLVPAFATAPALLIVGALMMMEVMNIDFNDFTEGFPAFMTIIMMPLTYSIASGFGFGFVSYAAVKLLSGRAREVSLFMWIITAMFVINFAMRS